MRSEKNLTKPVMTYLRTACLLVLLLLPTLTPARDGLSPRMQIGISLLPSVITASKSLAIDQKLTSIPVYLLYQDNLHQTQQIETALALIGDIRGRRPELMKLRYDDFFKSEPARNSVVYLVEPLDAKLDELVSFSSRHGALLFSPFEGDVNRGASTGFQVTDKVLPAVNITTLKASRIELKAFFLRIAVKHE